MSDPRPTQKIRGPSDTSGGEVTGAGSNKVHNKHENSPSSKDNLWCLDSGEHYPAQKSYLRRMEENLFSRENGKIVVGQDPRTTGSTYVTRAQKSINIKDGRVRNRN